MKVKTGVDGSRSRLYSTSMQSLALLHCLLLFCGFGIAWGSPTMTLSTSVASATSFRLSVRTSSATGIARTSDAAPPRPLPSASLWSGATPAAFRRARRDSDGAEGVITSFGSLWVGDQGWQLQDSSNTTLVEGRLPVLGDVGTNETGLHTAVLLPVTGTCE